MFKKYFYFVRHGETILNKEHKRQDAFGKLSEEGIKQVEELSARLLKIPLEKFFVSPYERTLQTADIINSYLKIKEDKFIITPFLVERKNPTCIIGKSYDDEVAKAFIEIMDKSVHEENLRLYDEENFLDLKQRAIKCQNFLIQNGSKKNLCITHGIFLKMFLSTLLFGKNLKVSEYIEMNLYNPADNAGITLVVYDSWKAFWNPVKIFFFNLLNESDNGKNSPEYLKNQDEFCKKNSPWKILAYNDYNRDGFERLHI